MSENHSVPVRHVLADAAHPAHAEVTTLTDKLARGEIRLCACTGPLCGEPHCPCEMTRRGLPPSAARLHANEQAKQQLQALVQSGALSPIAQDLKKATSMTNQDSNAFEEWLHRTFAGIPLSESEEQIARGAFKAGQLTATTGALPDTTVAAVMLNVTQVWRLGQAMHQYASSSSAKALTQAAGVNKEFKEVQARIRTLLGCVPESSGPAEQ